MKTLTKYELQDLEMAIEHLQILLKIAKQDENVISNDYINEKIRRCKSYISSFEKSIEGGIR